MRLDREEPDDACTFQTAEITAKKLMTLKKITQVENVG